MDNFVSCINDEYDYLYDKKENSKIDNDFIPINSVKTDIYYEIRTEEAAKALSEYKIEHGNK